jgi:hypothetical protein
VNVLKLKSSEASTSRLFFSVVREILNLRIGAPIILEHEEKVLEVADPTPSV